MIRVDGLTEGLELFKTLGSEVRMQIIELLSKEGPMNLNEMAQALNLTNGALTGHVRKLEECGIIQVKAEHTGRGMQKICSLGETQILLNIHSQIEEHSSKVYETELQIGHYSDYSVRSSRKSGVKIKAALCDCIVLSGHSRGTAHFGSADIAAVLAESGQTISAIL